MTTPPPIVIVDDDVDHAVIARTVLAMLAPSAAVEVVTDVRRVEEKLRAVEQGALILIDRVLDMVESFALVASLTDERPDLRVVMLSAAMSPEDARRGSEAGALLAVEKPGGLAAWKVLLGDILRQVGESDRSGSAGGAVA